MLRAGESSDVVDGIPARVVATPTGIDTLQEVMLATRDNAATVVVRGRGSKLDWGAPPVSVDVLLDMSEFDQVVEHAAGDLVVRVQSGVPLASLQEQLASAGQWLALDPPEPGATVGGVIATAADGPRRLRYGGVRDLLIGVTVVLADGTVATSGGKVVKNVAGYDLGKLYTGSLGTLGVIAEAVFRLHPLPGARRVVRQPIDGAPALRAAITALRRSQLTPTAVEFDSAIGELAVLFEGTPAGVDAQAAALSGSVSDELPEWWYADRWLPDEVGVRVCIPPARLPDLLASEPEWRFRASALSGIANAATAAGDVCDAVAALRAAATAYGGSAVVRHAPRDVKEKVDVWGPVPAVDLMQRIKSRFDPDRRLAPGRFVGGI